MPERWSAIESDRLGNPLPLAQDPARTWVYCSREVWESHILARHPEIASLKDLIVIAIETPAKQEPDPEDRRLMRYYTDVPVGRIESRHSLWLRVVVKYVHPPERSGQRTGLLSSAYLVRKE